MEACFNCKERPRYVEGTEAYPIRLVHDNELCPFRVRIEHWSRPATKTIWKRINVPPYYQRGLKNGSRSGNG